MNRRLGQAAAAMALVLAAGLLPVPAYAADTLTLIVDGVTALPGGELTVGGDAGPDCVVEGTYEVTVTYTNADGDEATAVVGGVLPAVDSVFSTSVVIPEDALAGTVDDAPASVAATATCDGETATSQTEQIEIEPHEGELTVEPAEVEAGDAFTVSFTECWGLRYEVIIVPAGQDFGDVDAAAAESLAPGEHSFSVDLAVDDDAPAGDYDVYAICPGTSPASAGLTVAGAAAPPGGPRPTPSASPTATPTAAPPAAPATPVDAEADFTG